mmetsp:Transcript_48623/g.97018  ORF Transcript_48623/g.97018 Transcript_48623/m.97018 type:complete len:404 (-) Transcript_48623:195-1406(-)
MRRVAFLSMVSAGCALDFKLGGTCTLPHVSIWRAPLRTVGRSIVTCMVLPDDDSELSSADMQRLRGRIQKIQKDGLASPAQKLFEIATYKSPHALLTDFFAGTSPEVSQAMQDAVTSLLGVLPPLQFDTQMTTTGGKLAALMLQLQMTGYMLRNAEYVLMLRRLFRLKTRSASEYREAFDRVDLDGSGFIDAKEIETLLSEVYPSDGVPAFEIKSFLGLFDADGDGKVGWDEFANAMGVGDNELSVDRSTLADASDTVGRPAISGTLTVKLDDGTDVEMDASAYMEQLAAEASSLQQELLSLSNEQAKRQSELSGSIATYVASLPEAQLKALTSSISDDVVSAMRELVKYILRSPSGDGPLAKEEEVTMEQGKLQALCLYQLVLGYRLREAEATGEADEAIGS